MRPSIKKLIGTILTLIWLPVYALAAMAIGLRILPHAGALAAFLYYALAGTLWAVPVGMLFPWMLREPTSSK